MRKEEKKGYVGTNDVEEEDGHNTPMIKRQAIMVRGQEAGQAREILIYNAPKAG